MLHHTVKIRIIKMVWKDNSEWYIAETNRTGLFVKGDTIEMARKDIQSIVADLISNKQWYIDIEGLWGVLDDEPDGEVVEEGIIVFDAETADSKKNLEYSYIITIL